MPNYQLWFRLSRCVIGDADHMGADDTFSRRVICMPDYVTALKVAQAMVGEEIYGGRFFLSKLEQCVETSNEPDLAENIFAEGMYVWDRVLEELRLTVTDVEFIRVAYTVHCEKYTEIVGFKQRAA